MTSRRHGDIRNIRRDQSLHAQGAKFQRKYIVEQAEMVLEGLDDLIAATVRAAPIRAQPYPLVRHTPGTPTHEEARWERAIWAEWHEPTAVEFIPGICHSILSYQVMLRDTNDDLGWGEVDLLGRSVDGTPVIVELKGPSSTETPLRGIVEGVAYAVAIRRAWDSCLGSQWGRALQIEARPSGACAYQSVFAAPTAYWRRVTGQEGPRWRVSQDGWRVVGRLIDALAARHLPVSLVELDAIDPVRPRGIRGVVLDPRHLV